MLNKLSRKAFTPYGIEEQRQIYLLHKQPLFIIGLAIKLLLIISITPYIHTSWFLPFVFNSLTSITIDPWSSFIENNNQINSFPYGLSMLAAYSPLTLIGINLDKLFSTNLITPLSFRLTSLVFDYSILIFLALILKNYSHKILLFTYWCSPLVIFITYVHGQIDVVPVMLLLSCICMVGWNRYRSAGILIALAVSSKFSMLIAVPLIIIFIHRRKGLDIELLKFTLFTFIGLLLFVFPFIFSNGYQEMVFFTKEVNRLYSVFIAYGATLRVYVVPIVYLLTLYLVWRLRRITQDLFLIATGLGFFSLIIFIPPAPGWFVWLIPFLVYYQVRSKRDILTIGLLFNIVALLNSINTSNSNIILSMPFVNDNSYISNTPLLINQFYTNVLFTSQQALAILLAVRMYSYGLRRNSFYKITNDSFIISLSGNAFFVIPSLSRCTKNLFGQKFTTIIKSSTFIDSHMNPLKNINKPSENILDKSTSASLTELSYNYLNTPHSVNPVYSNHFSRGLRSLINSVNNTKTDFLILNDDINMLPSNLKKMLNLKLNLNMITTRDDFEQTPSDLHKFNINCFLTPVNSLNSNSLSSVSIDKYRFITYLPLGFIHDQLLRLSISICALKVDTELTPDKQWVKMIFEGEPSRDDISQIARSIIPQIDDFSLYESGWSSGYIGIMQILIISFISEQLATTSYSTNLKFVQ